MSGYPMSLTTPPVHADLDDEGLLTEYHVANGHWTIDETSNHGEFLLCGKSIDYSVYKGTSPNATDCLTCIERDA